MIKGLEQVISAFDRLDISIERHAPAFPADIKNNVVEDIAFGADPSVDTGRFLQAVNYHEIVVSGGYGFQLDAFTQNQDVYYDAFLEEPNKLRKDPVGRKHYQHGIENSDFEPIADMIVNDTFSDAFVI